MMRLLRIPAVLVASAAVAASTTGAAATPAAVRSVASLSVNLGGTPLQLVSQDGALWVLTCDHACSGQGKRSIGRIVKINPQNARVIVSTKLARPGAIAVGSGGIYATYFWRGTVRRLDPRTLRLSAALHLKLPFFITTSTELKTQTINIDVPGATGGATTLTTTQHFTTVQDLLQNVADARVWAGLHYRFSTTAGVTLGAQVSHYDLQHNFQPSKK